MNKLKILILGDAGMAGHIITRYLNICSNLFNIETTARNNKYTKPTYIIDIEKHLFVLDDIIAQNNYDYIINCIGVLVGEANKNYAKAAYVNSFFPHWLENKTKNSRTKIIHLSTDCVFDGKKGNYTEKDAPNEINFYGKSKALGEIVNNKDLTIRLSIIGTELKPNGTGLMHWVLNQKGEIGGYTKAIWNGITTLELAKVIDKLLRFKPDLVGLYQLAPDFSINKFDLLNIINNIFEKKLTIKENPNLIQNKTLVNNRKNEFIYDIPSYQKQIENYHRFINTVYYKNYEK